MDNKEMNLAGLNVDGKKNIPQPKEIKNLTDIKEVEKIEENKNIKPKEKEMKDKEVINYLSNELNHINFYSNQVQVNATLYQGMEIILKKLITIEGLLNEQNKTK